MEVSFEHRELRQAIDDVRKRDDEYGREHEMCVRVSDSGRVYATLQAGGRYHAQPVFRGRLRQSDDGRLRLTGVIRERCTEVLRPWVFWIIGASLAVVGVLAGLAAGLLAPAFLVCIIGAVALLTMGYKLSDPGPSEFGRDAWELRRALKQHLLSRTPGPGRRQRTDTGERAST